MRAKHSLALFDVMKYEAVLSGEIDYWGYADDFRADRLRRLANDQTTVCRQYRLLWDDLIEGAVKRAHAEALNEDEFEGRLLRPIALFVDELAGSFVSYQELNNRSAFWTHRSSPLQDIASKKLPHMNRDALQESVRLYLEMPIRHQRVDRLLVDSLIALELFAFGDEMLNEPKFPGLPARSPLRQSHPAWAFIKGQLSNLVLAIVLFVVALIPYKLGWIGDVGLAITGLVLVGLLSVLFAIALFSLPFFWRQQRKASQRIANLLESMVGVYAELNSSGLISARHLRERASKTAHDGVVWPSSLFVLLEDIEARGGRF